MVWHPVERAALTDALEVAGPGAPTLCAGWRTEHLAAHVVLRERSPLVAAGIVLGPLAGRTERATRALGDRSTDAGGWGRLLEQLRRPLPSWHPLHLAGDAAQLLELHVHTEDVRRGGPDGRRVPARPLSPQHENALWRGLVRMGGILYAGARAQVVLDDGAGRRHAVGRERGERVVVTGPVGEVVLHAFGRGRAARVDVHGADAAVARLDGVRPR